MRHQNFIIGSLQGIQKQHLTSICFLLLILHLLCTHITYLVLSMASNSITLMAVLLSSHTFSSFVSDHLIYPGISVELPSLLFSTLCLMGPFPIWHEICKDSSCVNKIAIYCHTLTDPSVWSIIGSADLKN